MKKRGRKTIVNSSGDSNKRLHGLLLSEPTEFER
jgi:hypothetical protein